MTKKKSKVSTKVIEKVITSNASQGLVGKKKKKKNKKKNGPGKFVPTWLATLADPFGHPPCSIPDAATGQSFKYTSRANLTIQTLDVSATPSTVHGKLIFILPSVVTNAGSPDTTVSTVNSIAFNSTLQAFGPSATISALNNELQYLPNLGSISPTVATSSAGPVDGGTNQWRPIACGARLTYTGTELNRAGKVTMGLMDVDVSNQGSVAYGSDYTNPFSIATGIVATNMYANSGVFFTPQNVLNRLRRLETSRTSDGVFELHWLPPTVPQYGAEIYKARFSPSDAADQFGSIPVIMIEGDITATAAQAGNLWNLEIIWHWESLCNSRYAAAISPTPSPYDIRALESSVNGIQSLRSSLVEVGGNSYAPPDGAYDGKITAGSSWEVINNYAGQIQNTFSQVNQFGQSLGIDNLSRNMVQLGLNTALQYGAMRGSGRRARIGL